jgi:hypothetical protein
MVSSANIATVMQDHKSDDKHTTQSQSKRAMMITKKESQKGNG